MKLAKNCLAGICLIALFCGCNQKPSGAQSRPHWEYKTVEVKNFAGFMYAAAYDEIKTNSDLGLQHSHEAKSGAGNFYLDGSGKDDYSLDFQKLGDDGWELVAATPETETIPDAEFYAGQDFISDTGKLKDSYKPFVNTRTGKILLIFKRQK